MGMFEDTFFLNIFFNWLLSRRGEKVLTTVAATTHYIIMWVKARIMDHENHTSAAIGIIS